MQPTLLLGRMARHLAPRALLTLCALCTLAGTLAGALGTRAHAYVLMGAKWQRSALPVTFKVNYASSRELGQTTTQQVVEASFSAWATPTCSAYRWTNQGNAASGVANANDNQNILLWRYDTWPRELGGSSTIGVTTPAYYPGTGGAQGTMIDADIQFNGIDYTWTTNPRSQTDVDAQSIITHESGHFLGLGHSNTASATMYYAYSGGTASRSLETDDINGVCTLYPSGPGTECTIARACPNAGTCQNGYCIAAAPDGGTAGTTLGDDCAGTATCGGSLFCVCMDQAQTQCSCTRDCSPTAACPNGWTCGSLQGGGGACIRNSGGTGGTGVLGTACGSGSDCANGYCVGTSGSAGLCSQTCGTQSPCPAGYRCATLQGGGGACVAGTTTPPADGGGTVTPPPDAGPAVPPQELGATCRGVSECRSNYCAYATQAERVCSKPCGTNGDCPESFECRASATGTPFCFVLTAPPADDAGTEPPVDSDGGTSGGGGTAPRGGCAAGGDDVGALWMLGLAGLCCAAARRRRKR